MTPINDAPDRLPLERYEQLYTLLCQSGVSVCRDGQSYQRLREMRALYEGYAETLSRHLRMPLPPWIALHPHKDNWLAVSKLRAQTEAANPSLGQSTPAAGPAQTIATLVDDHHDF